MGIKNHGVGFIWSTGFHSPLIFFDPSHYNETLTNVCKHFSH